MLRIPVGCLYFWFVLILASEHVHGATKAEKEIQDLLVHIQANSGQVFVPFDGKDFVGGDIPDGMIEGSTLDSCTKVCRVMENCAAYSFNHTTQRCFLKSSIPMTRPMAKAAVSTGVKTSRYLAVLTQAQQALMRQGDFTVFRDSDLDGGDIPGRAGFAIGSFDDCFIECTKASGCLAITFDQVENRCYLKYEFRVRHPLDAPGKVTAAHTRAYKIHLDSFLEITPGFEQWEGHPGGVCLTRNPETNACACPDSFRPDQIDESCSGMGCKRRYRCQRDKV